MKPLRVVLADDHTLVRESLVAVLESGGDIQVVGQAANGLEAIERIAALGPDVAVVDLSMPGISGLEVVRRLRQEHPATRVLVLTMHEEEEYVLHAVRAGASGFLIKDSPAAELVAAVRALAAGKAHFGPWAAKVLAEQMQDPGRRLDDPYGNLTAREREVFHFVVEGCTTKDIARKLGISVKTAENHRAHMMSKIGARNSAEVVRYAVRKGLVK